MAYINVDNQLAPRTLRNELEVNQNFTKIVNGLNSGYGNNKDIAVDTISTSFCTGVGTYQTVSNLTSTGDYILIKTACSASNINVFTLSRTGRFNLPFETVTIQDQLTGSSPGGTIYPTYSNLDISRGGYIDRIDTTYFTTGDVVILRSTSVIYLTEGGNINVQTSVSGAGTMENSQCEIGTKSPDSPTFLGGNMALVFYNSYWHGIMTNPRVS